MFILIVNRKSNRLSSKLRHLFVLIVALPVMLLITPTLSADLDMGFPWVTGLDQSRPPARGPRPAVNRQFIDAVHGTTIQRISEDATNWRRHEYSRRPAFNADSSRIIMRSSGGFWHLYRIVSNAVVYEQALPSPMTEPNWHPSDPDRYWYFEDDGEGRNIMEFNIRTQRSRVVVDFRNRLPWQNVGRVWTRWEGRPSDSGRIWCLMAETSDFRALGLFSYDMTADRILGSMDLAVEPDHVGTSASGRYCVPSSGASEGGTRAWTLDFSRFQQLNNGSEHSDVALDSNGRDVLVLADYASGWIRMADMATGRSTPLIPLYQPQGSTYSVHISGLATDSPGYAVVSTYNSELNYNSVDADYGDMWGHDRLSVVELKADPTIFNVAYMRNGRGDYWSEPQATVNRDLSRIIFASTWGSNSDSNSRSYMVTLPQQSRDAVTIRKALRRNIVVLERQVRGFALSEFRGRTARTNMFSILRETRAAIYRLDWLRSLVLLRTVRSRVDGCGTQPDTSDFVSNCVQQRKLRPLLSELNADIRLLR